MNNRVIAMSIAESLSISKDAEIALWSRLFHNDLTDFIGTVTMAALRRCCCRRAAQLQRNTGQLQRNTGLYHRLTSTGASRRHVLMFVAGPLVVLFAFFMAFFMITQGVAHVLPHRAPRWQPAHLLCMALLAANFFFNYTRAIFTDPGTPEGEGGGGYGRLLRHARDVGLVTAADYEAQQAGALNLATLADPEFALPSKDPFDWAFCRRSGKLKPPRAHFDGVTGQLVLNMDHYCVWVFNSIGYGNYRYFILTVLQLWLASVFGFLETLPAYVAQRQESQALNATIVPGMSSTQQMVEVIEAFEEVESLWQLLVLCVICIMVIGHFAGWHMWNCVINGRTTIEAYRFNAASVAARARGEAVDSRNPYGWGSQAANWRRHFGDRSFVAALLVPSTVPPPWPPYPCPSLLGASPGGNVELKS